jgi:hypothetical protein
MCFSEGASLTTLLVGLTSSAFVYSIGRPGDKVWGIFFAFVALMQLIEYLLWKHKVCDAYNKMLSIFGIILNLLQPVVFFFLIMVFKDIPNKKPLYVTVALYVALLSKHLIDYVKSPSCIVKGADGHLRWKWADMKSSWFFHLIYVVSFMSLAYFSGSIWAVWGMPLSYAVSYAVYSRTNVVGEMWCVFAVFAPIGYYLVESKKGV